MNIQIKHRFTAELLFEHDGDDNTISLTLSLAVKAGANLARANLAGANLAGAYLAGANLDGAYLAGAYLAGANLAGAYLAGAYLAGANLDGAYLAGAYLDGGIKIAQSERPIFQISGIGSVRRTFIGFMTEVGIRLRAGCFFGSPEEFRAKLKATHGDNVHAVEYEAALTLIELHFKLWPVATVPQEPSEISETNDE